MKAIKNPADWEKLQAEYKGKTNDKKQPLANFNEGEMVESAEVLRNTMYLSKLVFIRPK